ncbi:hypothetical protein [Hydrogenophaga electricum]|uniref:Uncharacterized protein n=1 Tax=Hydrogenophaga electricum TaxID=1230953 RepID=A0ABQ6C039_9BURK|nr:hypothetical protein [Hydrogenophaga electricum]GLS13606.1 hypothetical protein GCM10007935_10360 [Hydrogenophaga electricum]
MIVLGYIGNHASDDIAARIGWAAVRAAQKGATWRRVTHVEAVLAGTGRHCAIGSSSLRDGGVRIKPDANLTPANWVAVNVPHWDTEAAIDWFTAHSGEPYDTRGALATVLWFLPHHRGSWFCNEAVAAAHGVIDPHRLTPAAFFALALSQPGARICTAEFFAVDEPGAPRLTLQKGLALA